MDGDFKGNNKGINISTRYPENGKIRITCSGDFILAVRLPGWCREYSLNGGKNAVLKEDGFIYVEVNDGDVVEYELNMPVRNVQANPLVRQCCGRVAVCRGPVVYCAEGVDNPLPLKGLLIDPTVKGRVVESKGFGLPEIHLDGYRRPASDKLYYDYNDDYEYQDIKLIPYYAYANRGESDMIVWLTKK